MTSEQCVLVDSEIHSESTAALSETFPPLPPSYRVRNVHYNVYEKCGLFSVHNPSVVFQLRTLCCCDRLFNTTALRLSRWCLFFVHINGNLSRLLFVLPSFFFFFFSQVVLPEVYRHKVQQAQHLRRSSPHLGRTQSLVTPPDQRRRPCPARWWRWTRQHRPTPNHLSHSDGVCLWLVGWDSMVVGVGLLRCRWRSMLLMVVVIWCLGSG